MTTAGPLSCVVALTTCATHAEATTIATALVDERLVACVNIIPTVESIYRWENRLCHETEWLLMMKLPQSNCPALKNRLPALHSYECPELIIVSITDGLPAYLQWVGTP
ncbi:MAG: divalent-cation tolerance protein CutA [Deltaproteobacteria bacterium]|nr:divalent-cation tolerance protein CutA [Deltaproteobacteria bacterium]